MPQPGHTVGLPGWGTHESFLRDSGESLEKQGYLSELQFTSDTWLSAWLQVSKGCSSLCPSCTPHPTPGLLPAGLAVGGGGWKGEKAPFSQVKRRELHLCFLASPKEIIRYCSSPFQPERE